MNFPLPSSRARAGLFLMACFTAALVCYYASKNALAAYYLGANTRSGYERAVRLEPGDSRNWYLLGRSYLYDFEQPDPGRAIAALRHAVSLDPYSAEALLDLAAAYEGEGDIAQARAAYQAANKVYPLSADVCWSYGNFLLRQGEQDLAFARLRKAVELEPRRGAEAFSRALRVQPDPNVVLDKVVPASAAGYLPILQALSASGDLDTAKVVWKRLVGLNEKIALGDTAPIFNELFQQRRPKEAASLWPEAVAMMRNPPPPDPPRSLLWDGGFESGYAGGGFSWNFFPMSGDVQIALDRSEKHSGGASLRILFNGRENLNFEDGCHNIAPEAGKTYQLTGWVKTQSLTSSEGVRLQIFAFGRDGNQSVMTDEVHGTQAWKQLELKWTAPAGTEFGRVCVRRVMSDQPGSDVQGAAWIDDVSLVPADGDSAKP